MPATKTMRSPTRDHAREAMLNVGDIASFLRPLPSGLTTKTSASILVETNAISRPVGDQTGSVLSSYFSSPVWVCPKLVCMRIRVAVTRSVTARFIDQHTILPGLRSSGAWADVHLSDKARLLRYTLNEFTIHFPFTPFPGPGEVFPTHRGWCC